MVPYQRPIPERQRRGRTASAQRPEGGMGASMLTAWIQAEKMVQIAMMLPSAGFIGWLAGYGLDRWLDKTWIATAGAVFGIIAGLVGAIRMAMMYANDPAMDKLDANGTDTNNSDDKGDSGADA